MIPYNPLAGGLLTGKYRLNQKPAEGRFSSEVGKFGAIYQDRYWHDREFATIEKLQAIAREAAQPLIKLSIAWPLAHPAITSAIIGASRVEQLADTLDASDLEVSTELKEKLDEATVEYRWGDAVR